MGFARYLNVSNKNMYNNIYTNCEPILHYKVSIYFKILFFLIKYLVKIRTDGFLTKERL